MPQSPQILSFSSGSFGNCLVKCSKGKKNWSRMRENDMLCVLGHHRGKLFLRQHYSSVNLGFPIKMDHTANMKYTLCIEHLIKYWLQTYMNLPHQIEPPVGGLALIRCIWYGNESRKQQGPLRNISCVVNLFILLSSPKWNYIPIFLQELCLILVQHPLHLLY